MKTKHEVGITADKYDDFSDWYRQILIQCQLINYYDVSGCYVLLPNSFFVWEKIKEYLDNQFKLRDVQNVYFPLLISKRNLESEQSHIAGFSPEVAWITKTGNTELTVERDGVKDETNHIAIRPTSECAIYPILPNLISSYADLPLKYNQWCNVVRWEFTDATPFLRSREFLWQEGHTCHRNKELAQTEVKDILNLYSECYREILAIPTIKGYKTEKEKFCGAELTATIESYIPGPDKAIQCATVHCLGQNFAKIFNIKYNDPDGQNKLVWQNSWGFTTRSIGVMLITHGDSKGIVYPPRVAPVQIVIIPIIFKKTKESVLNYADQVYQLLKDSFRVKIDLRDHNPGWKQNYWETMGVPVRIEIGPRDVTNRTVRIVRRDTGEKTDYDFSRIFVDIPKVFQFIQQTLYYRALEKLDGAITKPTCWKEFCLEIQHKKLCLVPFCNQTVCETEMKSETGAKALCIPTDKEFTIDISENFCVKCNSIANTHCLFGKSF